MIVDAETLKVQDRHEPEGKHQPRFVHSANDGLWFSVVFHNGNLWLYDTKEKRLFKPSLTGQGRYFGGCIY